VFLLAYRKGTPVYNALKRTTAMDWLLEKGTIAKAFPIGPFQELFSERFELSGDIVSISKDFNNKGGGSPFENTGLMLDGKVTTFRSTPSYQGVRTLLGDIILDNVLSPDLYIAGKDLERWKYLKGPKKEMRTNSQGYEYHYSEGGMTFPDPLDRPSRTIITGEGGRSASRFKHVIETKEGYRRLSPIELERLNMFPDDHTRLDGVSDTKRAFFMGNALVVGVIERIGTVLAQQIEQHGRAKDVRPEKPRVDLGIRQGTDRKKSKAEV